MRCEIWSISLHERQTPGEEKTIKSTDLKLHQQQDLLFKAII